MQIIRTCLQEPRRRFYNNREEKGEYNNNGDWDINSCSTKQNVKRRAQEDFCLLFE